MKKHNVVYVPNFYTSNLGGLKTYTAHVMDPSNVESYIATAGEIQALEEVISQSTFLTRWIRAFQHTDTISKNKEKLFQILYPDTDDAIISRFFVYSSKPLPLSSATLVEQCASQELVPERFNFLVTHNPFHRTMFERYNNYSDAANELPNYGAALYVALGDNVYPAVIGARMWATALSFHQHEIVSFFDEKGILRQFYTSQSKPDQRIGKSGIPIFNIENSDEVDEPVLVDAHATALQEVQNVFGIQDPVERLNEVFGIRYRHAFSLAGVDASYFA